MSQTVAHVGGLATALQASLGGPLALLVGALLLLFGRRLYWLLAGVVGFVAAFVLAPRVLPELDPEVSLVVALLAGLAGAVVVVFAHKLVLALVGGLAGALVALWQAQSFGVERGLGWIVAILVGALLGGWLVRRVFDFALALLSALIGAQLILDAIPVTPGSLLPAYLLLVAFGVVVQLFAGRRRRRRRQRHRAPRESD